MKVWRFQDCAAADSPSALKAVRTGAAISSSTEDSILLSPSINQGVWGRLRQNLLYLPERKEEQEPWFGEPDQNIFQPSTCYEDGHVETLDVLRDAAAGGTGRRTRVLPGKFKTKIEKEYYMKKLLWGETYFRNLSSDIFSRALTTAMRVNTDCKHRRHSVNNSFSPVNIKKKKISFMKLPSHLLVFGGFEAVRTDFSSVGRTEVKVFLSFSKIWCYFRSYFWNIKITKLPLLTKIRWFVCFQLNR